MMRIMRNSNHCCRGPKRSSLGLLVSLLALLRILIRHNQEILELLACICLSFAGLHIRVVYGDSVSEILRDCLSIVSENSLIFHTLRYILSFHNLHVCSVLSFGHNQKFEPSRQHTAYNRRRKHWLPCCLLFIRITIALSMILLWFVATFGDLMFQQQTHGAIPSLWIIAAGLKDPSVHVSVQVQNPYQRKRFIDGASRVLQGLTVACALLLFQSLHARSNSKDSCRQTTSVLPRRSCNYHHKDDKRNIASRWRTLILLLTLYYFCGAWAPVTNLTCAIVGFMILTPPGSRVSSKGTQSGNANFSSRSNIRPNVILVVHESLSGWALETTRGKDATPFYQSLQERPHTYVFGRARTVAGTTTIATPAILTGLLAYDHEGVSVLEGSTTLAADFRMAGYDTGSFVSYGTDWSGTGWAILSNLLRKDFNHIIGPKETNEPRVNEYGMDDRVTMKYFKDWILSTMGALNTTKTTSNFRIAEDSDPPTDKQPHRSGHLEGGRSKPFFATIVFQNQHFPHLMHESYSGYDLNCSLSNEESADGDVSSDDNETLAAVGYGQNYNCWEQLWSPISRYYSSLRTMDESLRLLFEILNATGDLDDTIIVAAGDHGETPGVQKRLKDIDGPILVPPVWMHIPDHFLPARAFPSHNNAGENQVAHANVPTSTSFLRLNTRRTVSTLDVMPTLKDILGFPEPYTKGQKQKCVTGISLLSQLIPENRIVVGWGGTPQDGINVGTFASETKALFYYPREESKSRVAELRFSDVDPFFTLYEKRLKNMEIGEIRHWRETLETQGLLAHDLVKTRMPRLREVLDGH